MNISISEEALNNNPTKKELTTTQALTGKLNSNVLNSSEYLVLLSINDSKTKALYEGMNNSRSTVVDAIKTVKLALSIIDDMYGSEFNLTHKFYKPNGVYDSKLTTGIKEFKQFLQTKNIPIEINGIVDAETIHYLDIFLSFQGKYFYDHISKEFQGIGNKSVDVQSVFDKNTKTYAYHILISDNYGNKLERMLKIDGALSINPVFIQKSTEFGNTIYIEAHNIIKEYIKIQHPDIDMNGIKTVQLGISNLKIKEINNKFTLSNLSSFYNLTPPKPCEGAVLYTMKSGDSLVDIILNNYYIDQQIIENPYDPKNPVFTFPARKIPKPEDKPYDSRFLFYLNLLYYSNSRVEADGTITEWGIKTTNGYQRYNVDHLDAVNIFDNKLDMNNSNTALPNYYRFFKKQETLNPATKIQFDANKELISFVIVTDKNIWIPPRHYVEAMYNYLNFRPFEMLEEKNGILEYVKETALNILSETVDAIQEISQDVKNSIKEGYKETLKMMKDAYNFAINSLAQYWPRGMGGRLDKKIGVTWGIPLATDVSSKKRIWRKMTKSNELTIMYREEISFYIGADAAVGVSAGVGKNMGAGKSKRKTLGLKFGAGIQAGVEPKLTMEYEFPIRPEETALISMMIAIFGGTLAMGMAEMINWLTHINLSPEQYLSKLIYGLEVRADAWAAAQIGVTGGNADAGKNIKTKKSSYSKPEQESDRSFLNIHNIMDKLPGMGVGAEGEVALGVECEYKAKYDDGCIVFEAGGRVPNEVELNGTLYAKGMLNTNAMGSFLQKLLMRTSLPAIFSIDFEGGVMVGVTRKGKRTCKAAELSYNDVKIPDSTSVSHYKGGLVYGNSPKFTWSSFLEFGKFSGEVEEFCLPGSETRIKLDLGILLDDAQYTATQALSKILEIPYSFTFRTKIGASLDSRHSMNLSDEIINAFKNNKHSHREWVHKTELLNSAKKLAIDTGAYLDVEVEIIVQRIMEILKFYFKKAMIESRLNLKDKNKLESHIINKRNILTNKMTNTLSNQGGEFYKKLFTGLNTFLDNNYADELRAIFDYKPALIKYLGAFEQFVHYLEAFPDSKIKEMGIDDIVNGISFPRPDIQLESVINYSVSLQAQAGIGGSFNAKAGEGATVRLAFEAFAALIDDTILYDDKEWSGAFNMDDPLKAAMLAVKKALTARTGKRGRNGVESAIGRLQN